MRAFVVLHPTVFQVAVGFVFVLGRILMAADLTELEDMLHSAIMAALNDAHIAFKAAADYMGMDEKQLHRQLDPSVPKQYVSILRLLRLPFNFWMSFGPRLIQIVYLRRMSEMKENLRLRERA